ncbi:MAG: CvpA family protein [Dokdonella sp.]
MNYADIAILFVLGLSVIVGLLRGFVSEVWALACWIFAGWVAWYCGPFVETWLPQDFASPGLRLVMAYIGCFILVVIAGSLVGYLLRRLVSGSGLSGTDRLLGLVFGVVRGVAVIVLLVLMLGFTPFHRDAWWQESRLLPIFESAATSAKAYLPAELSNYLRSTDAAAGQEGTDATKRDAVLVKDVPPRRQDGSERIGPKRADQIRADPKRSDPERPKPEPSRR